MSWRIKLGVCVGKEASSIVVAVVKSNSDVNKAYVRLSFWLSSRAPYIHAMALGGGLVAGFGLGNTYPATSSMQSPLKHQPAR